MQVEITGAPGFVDNFKATLVSGLHRVGTVDGQPVTVVTTEVGEYLAVPSKHVRLIPQEGSRVIGLAGRVEGQEGTVTLVGSEWLRVGWDGKPQGPLFLDAQGVEWEVVS